jgi:hypothetical protein
LRVALWVAFWADFVAVEALSVPRKTGWRPPPPIRVRVQFRSCATAISCGFLPLHTVSNLPLQAI